MGPGKGALPKPLPGTDAVDQLQDFGFPSDAVLNVGGRPDKPVFDPELPDRKLTGPDLNELLEFLDAAVMEIAVMASS
jgi:hypothetical protein